MQRHEPPIRRTVRRWASASNRRRGAEELTSGLALVLAAAIVGLGILRLPAALHALGIERTDAWPSDRTVILAAAVVVGITFVVALARAIVRYRRRRIG